jgi:hypothetical protein
VVKDYRPTGRRPLIYRQNVTSCHRTLLFSFNPTTNPGEKRQLRQSPPPIRPPKWQAQPQIRHYPLSHHAFLLSLAVWSVAERLSRVKKPRRPGPAIYFF